MGFVPSAQINCGRTRNAQTVTSIMTDKLSIGMGLSLGIGLMWGQLGGEYYPEITYWLGWVIFTVVFIVDMYLDQKD